MNNKKDEYQDKELLKYIEQQWKSCETLTRIQDTFENEEEEMNLIMLKAKLYDYQLKGLKWLIHLWKHNMNGILGDEMGLGKTLEAISMLCYLFEKKNLEGLFLVICPLSVVENWCEQLMNFSPSFKFIKYLGDKEDRKELAKTLETGNEKKLKRERESNDQKFHILLTTYEICLRDKDFLRKFQWEYCIVDEAHRLKNCKSLLYKMLKSELKVFRWLLMTGTPVQNNLYELHDLLAFLHPNIFNNSITFVKAYLKDMKSLHKIVNLFLLRRTIRDTSEGFKLPSITEVIVHTGMSSMQKFYYQKILSKELSLLNLQDSRILMNIIINLRKVCNHPYLFPGAEPEPFHEGDHLWKNSGKLWIIDRLLPKLKEEGHRVLIFCQSIGMLDIIQDYLKYREYSYERLDGSVRGDERWNAISRFQLSKSDSPFVFLLSTRAGGVGLNLQQADTVIFIDSDWNPQMDLQAIGRVFRLGQKKPVRVIRLVTANSVEEIIFRRTLSKMELTSNVFNQEDRKENTKNASILAQIIQYGLHRVVDENADTLKDEHIETILENSVKVSTLTQGSEDTKDLGGDIKEENFYYYQGQDYRHVEGKEEDNEILRMLGLENNSYTEKTSSVRTSITSRNASPRYDQDIVSFEEAQERKREKAKERKEKANARNAKAEAEKLELWEENKYTSFALKQCMEDSVLKSESCDERIHYVRGDASKPLTCGYSNAIIVHCVDDSGKWCKRGFFSALDALSSLPRESYELAGRMKDLYLGQAHLIPIPLNQNKIYVCLFVVYKRHKNGILTINMKALEQSCYLLSSTASKLHAAVHMPRFGSSQLDWYAAERIIKNSLALQGTPTFIYYYSRAGNETKRRCLNP